MGHFMKKFVILSVLACFLLQGCASNYEGKTAKEWFEMYDDAEARVENFQNQISEIEAGKNDSEDEKSTLQDQLDDLQNEYDDLVEKYKELQDQQEELLDKAKEIQDQYESLKSCILMEGDDAEDCYYRY